jgi:hypothetical protein
MMKNLKKRASCRKHRLPKNLIRRLPVQDHWGRWLRRSALPIADAHRQTEWISLGGVAAEEVKPRCVDGSWLFVVAHFVVATCTYREDPPRVTVSDNQLGLSLSKCIRHGLIVKINGKRKPPIGETLGQISADHSYILCALITSPCLAQPGPTRWVSVCVSPFLLCSTLLQVNREQLTF